MRMKPLAVVACAALAVTAFSACGDDDDDDTPDVSVPAAVTDLGSIPADTTATTTS